MRRAGIAALALAFGLAGCGAPAAGESSTITVFAAASLTESFTSLGKQFEDAHRGTTVKFNFAGSSALATQINQGAPADVFASAAPTNMAAVTSAVSPVTFVKNQLVIATAKGNPKQITGLADLTRPGLKVALCAPEVPCGAAAGTAVEAAGVELTPVTLEQDVKAALAKVKLGEVDAALVYRTDAAAAAAALDAVEFPESATAINEYPIAVLKGAANPAGAQEFVDYVRSADGLRVLTAAGFQAP
ncbi:molybdate transport system substrate-binding protein [Actinoplanes octamycinicus]|uniref:Molybdate transport system substrate-binding protein n=1 Tax=Actinoplanes octamycinicus TaxID=135948 RepID=A0A7W7GUR4_9ACTN|nr:molybdate ABC transporter substrate-binding protein [Actinoplanes octamycinicus]MBB4738674.1 molybdate transport system substrate-binding protein [Actinoplanes octamycinicus]GIE61407.1 molybdate-binding protein [Actinoplanes octamycinicus]